MLTLDNQYYSVWNVRETREGWIAAGLNQLASAGVDGISVESLARSLGVTKGSFYWHFEDRADLLGGVLNEWERREGERFILGPEVPVAEKLAGVLAFATNPEQARLEAAFQDWARRDSNVAQRVANVEGVRKKFIAQLFEDLGFEPQQAAVWASAAYLTLLGVVECCSRADVPAAARDESAERFSLMLRGAAALEGNRIRAIR